jgi:hypothetical protein
MDGIVFRTIAGSDHYNPICVAIWEWAQHHAVDNGEHGCVRANSQRQREYGQRGEAGIVCDLPQSETNALDQEIAPACRECTPQAILFA